MVGQARHGAATNRDAGKGLQRDQEPVPLRLERIAASSLLQPELGELDRGGKAGRQGHRLGATAATGLLAATADPGAQGQVRRSH